MKLHYSLPAPRPCYVAFLPLPNHVCLKDNFALTQWRINMIQKAFCKRAMENSNLRISHNNFGLPSVNIFGSKCSKAFADENSSMRGMSYVDLCLSEQMFGWACNLYMIRLKMPLAMRCWNANFSLLLSTCSSLQ